MKAITLKPQTTDIKLEDVEEPQIKKDTEVKMKVLSVGICGTDREETSGGRADAPQGSERLIIGHEMVGQVVEVGNAVKKVTAGDYAVFTVRRGCGECEACEADRYDMCYTGKYKERGIRSLNGYQAEFAVDDEKYIIKIPEEIKDIAVLTEPTTVVVKAIDVAEKIQKHRLPQKEGAKSSLDGKTALIAGLGPIGLLAGMVLALRGAKIVGIDIVDENSARPKIFNEFGGTYLNEKNHSMEDISKKYPQIDIIVEAAGIANLDFQLFDLLGINGIYVLTGVPSEGKPLEVSGGHLMKQIVMKNQVVVGSVNASFDHFHQAVNDLKDGLSQWKETVAKIISHKIPYQDFKKVLQNHSSDEIKVIINWNTN